MGIEVTSNPTAPYLDLGLVQRFLEPLFVLGRKGDGERGWQAIWRGLETLLIALRGAAAMSKRCGEYRGIHAWDPGKLFALAQVAPEGAFD
jgi:hypothetical protein